MNEEKLHTATAEFESLWECLDKVRSTSQSVRVDKQALIHVLMDHASMFEALFKRPPVRPRKPWERL